MSLSHIDLTDPDNFLEGTPNDWLNAIRMIGVDDPELGENHAGKRAGKRAEKRAAKRGQG